jgi:endonuclease YncB( thermonuclease family)
MKARALFLLTVALLSLPALAAEPLVGTASVIDCDTIEVHSQRIRFHGIDAPESRQECTRSDGATWRCGQQAALALSARSSRAIVHCDARGHDRYGRIITVCFKDTEDLNRWMVARGRVVAYRKYSLDYVADEERAHLAKVGIWSGTFEMPWDWRSQKQQR